MFVLIQGKLAITTTTLTKASFYLERLSYAHAILGETVTLVSKWVEERVQMKFEMEFLLKFID